MRISLKLFSLIPLLFVWEIEAKNVDYLQDDKSPDSITLLEVKDQFYQAKSLLDKNQYSEAKKGFFSCIKRLKSFPENQFYRMSNNNLGRIFFFMGEYDSSLYFYNVSYEINTALKDSTSMGQNALNIGNVFLSQGKHHKAIEWYLESLKICETLNLEREVAMLYNNLGALYDHQNDLSTAVDYLLKSIDKKRSLGDSIGIARTYNNLFGIYSKQNNIDAGLGYLRKSISIRKKLNDRRGLSFAYNNLGEYFYSKQNIDSAMFYQQAALKIQQELGERESIVGTSLKLANYLSDVNPVLAKTYTEEDMAYKLGSVTQLAELYRIKAKIYANLNDFESAYKTYQLHKIYEDSILNLENSSLIAELQNKYDLAQKDQEIKLLNAENELKESRNQRQKLYTQMWLGGFLLMLIIVGILYRYIRVSNKTTHLLKEKNAEIRSVLNDREVLLKEIHHRVKNNLQIVASLLNLQNHFAEGKEAGELLKLSQDRIQTMSLIHEQLYQTENLAEITFKTYIDELIKYFKASYSTNNISFETDISDIRLAIDKLVPFGLILNELITNSIKYAFENHQGSIIIHCHQTGKSTFCLNYRDTGKGPGKGFKFESTSSLGLSLVKNLVMQIEGFIEPSAKDGFGYRIVFNA